MDRTLIYPTGGEYRDALFNTRLCFKDAALKGATVTMDALGMPKPISGAFASVFTVQNADQRRWAVKCFTRFVYDQSVRYQRISEALQVVDKPWRVEFQYLTEGVLCQGTWYPALKMEWIEASGLIPYIEAHLWDSKALVSLAAKFAQMVEDLSVLGIAHGDLQHGNLLVTPSGELKLIDYDGMYVPSLAQLGACENGHVNYQSPARTMSSWGPYLDNFSAWIIYASLIALAIDPGLWSILHNEGDEALIFHKDDYIDPRHSQALLTLAQDSQVGLRDLTGALGLLWTPDLRAIPALNAARLPAPSIQHVRPPLSPGSASTVTGSIPDWVLQSQTSKQAAPPGLQGDPSWVAEHLPPLPLVPFNPPRARLRIVTALWLAATIATALGTGAGILTAAVAALSVSILAFVYIAVTVAMYRSTHEWRAKHERRIELKNRQTSASTAARELAKLGRTRRDVDVRERKEVEKITKEADTAKASEQKELADLNTRLTGQVQNLDKQRQKLQSSESKEIGNALRMLQRQHVTSHLQAARIRSAGIPGIGPGIVASLAASGITSAADFTGVYYQTGPRGGQQVYIRHRNGVAVHPSGVGEKKARALEGWRRALEARAMATQPTSLPPVQAQTIKFRYTQQREALAHQERAARVRATDEQNQVRRRWTGSHNAISTRMAATRQAFAQERAETERQLAIAQTQRASAEWQRVLAKREESAYGKVRYRRYLAETVNIR